MSELKKLRAPLEQIEWRDPNTLTSNDYNPNHVAKTELRLLGLSIERTGWIQPVLITPAGVIIDGFHRSMIAKDKQWLVPCAILDISEVERMFLTIRINRAKGTHVAFKMADVIQSLVKDHGVGIEAVAANIGATKEEINLLLIEDVFEKFDVKNHKYNEADSAFTKKAST